MFPKAIMLFAAGFGTRMGELTANQPKPMVPVAGRPLVDYALDLTDALPDLRRVANLHYMPDSLRNYLEPRGIALSYEQPDILDTGGGLRAALPLLRSDPVFTLNTDALWFGSNPLQLLLSKWKPDKMDALLMCAPKNQAVGYVGPGDFDQDAEGRLMRGADLVYCGAQIIKTDRLAGVTDQSFSLNRVWDLMLADKSLFATVYDGEWCDVGHPDGIKLAEEILAKSHV